MINIRDTDYVYEHIFSTKDKLEDILNLRKSVVDALAKVNNWKENVRDEIEKAFDNIESEMLLFCQQLEDIQAKEKKYLDIITRRR